MNIAERIILVVMLALASILSVGPAALAVEPLPGTCGLQDDLTSTFAFAGPGLAHERSTNKIDMAACQAMDFDTVYVFGCGLDHYAFHTEYGALNLSLTQAGFRSHYRGDTTLLDVVSNPGGGDVDDSGVQTYDPYFVQAVTAYLNSLYVDDYTYTVQEVLDGYHEGVITEGGFAWNNHGAVGRNVVSNCPDTQS